MPSRIEFADGRVTQYTYSADGVKLRAIYTTITPATTKQVDYCGNLIFENGTLKQMLVDGGYIPMDDWSVSMLRIILVIIVWWYIRVVP